MSCMMNICGSAMYAVPLCNRERKREGEKIRLHWVSWAIDSSVEPRRVKISGESLL